MPEGAIADQASASYDDGVLEIVMPAPGLRRGRRIDVVSAHGATGPRRDVH